MTRPRCPATPWAALARFRAKVRVCPVTGCHQWQGAVSRGGTLTVDGRRRQLPYGSFYACRGLVLRAHIFAAWAFGLVDGPRVPAGHELDHTCENTLCVNPGHLELVTCAVNQARRHGQEARTRPTWAERYALRGVGAAEGVEAVPPRHLRGGPD